MTFTPKSVEQIKSEVLTDLGIEYEGNETSVDAVVATRLKDEEFKASVHDQKEKHKTSSELYKQRLEAAGIDPETGEKKVVTKVAEPVAPKEEVFTPKDYLALTEHKIGSEDFDEVVRLSKILGKPIAETLKDKTTQVILQVRKEERATAEATAITATRQKSGQTLEEKVLSNRNQGRLPETEEESAALAQAEFNKLLKGTK